MKDIPEIAGKVLLDKRSHAELYLRQFKEEAPYIITQKTPEPEIIFDNVKAWKVRKFETKYGLGNDNRIKINGPLGGANWFLTEDGYLLSQSDVQTIDHEAYLRDQYSILIKK